MQDKIVEAFDLHRMLIGDQPPWFLAEIVVRTLIVYGYTLLLLRQIGGRTIGQLSMVEFLLVIALGSAVGDPMFYPEVPLLHALTVITVIVLFNKGLDMLVARSTKAERFIDGEPVEVIRDGRIAWDMLARQRIGHNELFERLRSSGVDNIGHVRGAYFEASGHLSVFQYADRGRHEGLPIVPPWEIESPAVLSRGDVTPADSRLACQRCGTVAGAAAGSVVPPCPECGGERWSVLDRGEGTRRNGALPQPS